MRLLKTITSSLRAKLLTMFVILTCVPLISVGLISYQKSFTTVYNNSKTATKIQAQQLARDIDNLFMDTRKLLELGKDPKVLQFLYSQDDSYENAKDILRTMSSYRQTYRYENVLNITMVNLYGRGISERQGVFQINRNAISNPHFTYLFSNTDAVLSIPSSDPSALKPLDDSQYVKSDVISIVTTIKQRITHEIIGFIIVDVDDNIVKRFCDEVTIGTTGFFYVVNQAGETIFKPSRLSSKNSKVPTMEQVTMIMTGEEGSLVEASEGKPKFIVASSSKATGWSIIGIVPLQEIVADANAIRQLIIISVGLSIVFAITLHYFITNRLTLPLHVLKNKMQLASSGFLEAKVTISGTDEVADLGNSFNTMIDKIRRLLDQSIEEQQEMKKSELRALQAQINPHFLYNTLDSILWLAEAGRKEQVVELVLAVSRLFRISLSKGNDWIPIKKELEHIQSYLTIQQTRYRDILDYEINVSPEIHSSSILKTVLQPIVENALYHGLKNKRGKGMIRVTGYSDENNDIILIVEDNGIGMTEERLMQLRKYLDDPRSPQETGKEISGGFGLHNVNLRLRLYYGEAHGVQVTSQPLVGTTVTIRVPTRLEDPHEKSASG
ncbi:cache domain-containing sensor histidine kinase [Paenibacillus silviterrae]|uniref:cache domain-containing sensor histidine kinase n=1 Tax=Paenibacillus silviterrae TaxID=3242194 RepID=UPI002543C931|nr:sensor histidine kinase [Paenibacillus chinjuensis]